MKTLNCDELEAIKGGGFWAIVVAVVTVCAVVDATIDVCKGIVEGYVAASQGK